jgi:hypothetical protein
MKTTQTIVISGCAGLLVAWLLWHHNDNSRLQPANEQTTRPKLVPSATSPSITQEPRLPVAAANDQTALVRNGPRDLVRDPRAKGYSGVDLFRAGPLGAAELFALEPRVEPWASRRENQMLSYAQADIAAIDPKATVKIECRTTICRSIIVSESPFLTSEFGPFPFGCGGAIVSGDLSLHNDKGQRFADLYSVWSDESLDESSCPAARSRLMESLKHPFEDQ